MKALGEEYLFRQETDTIIGIAMEIHRYLGPGFSEIVYRDAFEYECRQRDVFYEREKEYSVNYKGTVLPHRFYADFVVFDKIILEVKCKKGIVEEYYAQVLNYLAVSSWQVGLLINFHEKSLEYKWIILTK